MNDLSHDFITGKQKAHIGENMDFSHLIASYAPATIEQLQHDQTLLNLQFLLGDGKLFYINDDIKLNGKVLTVNAQFIYTRNSIATLLYDEKRQPSGIAFFPLDKSKATQCYYTDPDKLQAFVLGNGMGEVIAIDRLDHAISLPDLMGNADYIAFIPFDKQHFENMVLNLARLSLVTVIADSDKQARYSKVFKDHDVKLVLITAPLSELAVIYDNWDSLLTDGLEAGEISLTNFYAQNLDHAKAQITQLAKYDELTYQLKKRGIAKELGIGVTDLDRVVKHERQGLEVNKIASMLQDIEPYAQAVNGDKLAYEIYNILKNHIACDESVLVIATLWLFFS